MMQLNHGSILNIVFEIRTELGTESSYNFIFLIDLLIALDASSPTWFKDFYNSEISPRMYFKYFGSCLFFDITT